MASVKSGDIHGSENEIELAPAKIYSVRRQPQLSRTFDPTDFSVPDPRPSVENFVKMKSMQNIGVAHLKAYWEKHLPIDGEILDFNSSGESYFPASLRAPVRQGKLRVTICTPYFGLLLRSIWAGRGSMRVDFNRDLIKDNRLFRQAHTPPPGGLQPFNTVVNVLNAHCLKLPHMVFGGLWRLTQPGGEIHLVVGQNSLDESMAARLYLGAGRGQKISTICDFLHLAG
ncbi:hypothetical protein O1611_g6659 [Lasiodiplodia mahajangana]|uniref:Uncharacterized protein n=1 Tax=Lasiodiplodia mahajangana TaxID=1108764 RepID=A0ACC2JHJ3_9PEZI|nr:hypothetical protein O1611_g6659 [Lasiodiplodia mahajangana]